MKTYTVTFTDEEAAAIERYAESMAALGWQDCTPEQWIRDLVADHLNMRRFVVMATNTTRASPTPPVIVGGDWF